MRFILLILLFLFTGCTKFLEEEPTGFIDASKYYSTPEQVKAAVAGTYSGLGRVFSYRIGLSVSAAFAIEYMTGYALRPYSPNSDEIQFLQLVKIDPANAHLSDWWNATYFPVENCNSVIANLSRTNVVDEDTRQRYLAEVHFLRAWYYFQGVRLFGAMPLKTTPTTDLSNTQIIKSEVGAIYQQIVDDLVFAEQSSLPWVDKTGHVTMGAVKSLLAKVYLTMAGYPLRKGKDYYERAFTKSREVIQSGYFSLFTKYSELRQSSRQNTGEHIFMLQRDPVSAPNIMHFSLMPYPYLPVSIKPNIGGALTPSREFYQSFNDNDLRKQEQQFFYTSLPEFNNPASLVKLPTPGLYKYWDSAAERTNRAGLNIDLIRYADVLLICSEAKAQVDGGSTSDASAIDAFWQVRNRAFPFEAKPHTIYVDQILTERFFELCFEFQSWYDMLRTRKALDVSAGRIVDLVGYKAPGHSIAFTESNLLFPIPFSEVQKNPNLK